MSRDLPISTLPLEGIRVIEFCEIAAGPFCGLLLADLGADVVKIERPGTGDAMRSWPPQREGFGETFAALNRNKRSVALDLTDSAQRAAARRLVVETADVVVQNYRPGVMAKYGLDYESLSAERPNLLYCSISAFGQSGPRAAQGGFDLTIQAMAGVMSVTGERDGAPVKSGAPVSDFATAFYAALSIVSFLHEVRQTGRGRHLDVSMFGATLGFSMLSLSELFGNGVDPRKHGSAHPRNAPYRAFAAADDHFVIAAGNDRLWQSVCAALRREDLGQDLAQDPRFATTTLRAANQDTLFEILSAHFIIRPVADWIALFDDFGVPCAPINTYSQALADPQLEHLGLLSALDLPNNTRTQTLLFPLHASGQLLPVRRGPPALGAHNDELIPQEVAPAPTAARAL